MDKIYKNKSIFFKAYFWIILSISFGMLAGGCAILLVHTYILDAVHFIFLIAAFACGVAAVDLLIKTKKGFRLSGVIQILILFGSAFYLFDFELQQIHNFMNLNVINKANLRTLKNIRNSVNDYVANNKYLPDANHWCDAIIPDSANVDQYNRFAFNKNISSLSFEHLNGNEVLILETSDGIINNYGGAELLQQRLTRDKYCLLPYYKVTYVLFVDGTIAQYRRNDGAISQYKEEVDTYVISFWYEAFGPFDKKGETQYSPLKWGMN